MNLIAVKAQIEGPRCCGMPLDATVIGVEVLSGRVVLRGTVQSWIEREAAERAAWGVSGVSDVDNLLAVNPVSHLVSHLAPPRTREERHGYYLPAHLVPHRFFRAERRCRAGCKGDRQEIRLRKSSFCM